ncbi:MAG: hypothetical protein ABI604_17515 [Nitrospirota bacterium]
MPAEESRRQVSGLVRDVRMRKAKLCWLSTTWTTSPAWCHAYMEVQVQKALELAQLLVRHYTPKDAVWHEDIAPERKRDPGPAFPMEHVRASVLGREEEEYERYEVTASTLNIRSGPGVEFPSVAYPLKRGTRWRSWESAMDGTRWNW